MMGPKPAAPEPEPPAPAMADPPGAAATAGAGAGAPTPGFMKAARTPPLSTAAAITEPKLKLDCVGRGPHCSCTRSGRLSAAAHLSHTQICDGQRRSFASEENVEQMRSAVGRQAALNHWFSRPLAKESFF